MTMAKCPACDGYGTRPRPAHEPWEGPLACRACNGSGLIFDALAWLQEALRGAPTTPPLDPWLPAPPCPLPTVTWRVAEVPLHNTGCAVTINSGDACVW